MVMQEALRFMPPVPWTTAMTFSKDDTLGKYKIMAGTDLVIDIVGIHFNGD